MSWDYSITHHAPMRTFLHSRRYFLIIAARISNISTLWQHCCHTCTMVAVYFRANRCPEAINGSSEGHSSRTLLIPGATRLLHSVLPQTRLLPTANGCVHHTTRRDNVVVAFEISCLRLLREPIARHLTFSVLSRKLAWKFVGGGMLLCAQYKALMV